MIPYRGTPSLVAAALLVLLAVPLAAAPALGPQVQVNVSTLDTNANPQVAAFPDGGFVVVWQATAKTGAKPVVFHARSFAPDGSPAGGEFLLVRPEPASDYSFLDGVAAIGNGRFVVAWEQLRPVAPAIGHVFMQVFSRAGTALTGPVTPHGPSPAYYADATLTVGADGRIAILWAAIGLAPYPGPCATNVYARIFSPRLTPLTEVLTVDLGSDSDCSGPLPDAVALGADDAIVSALTYWGSAVDVYVVRIAKDGSRLPVDTECPYGVSCAAPATYDASLALAPDGGYEVVWDEQPQFYPITLPPGMPYPALPISGRRFAADGTSAQGEPINQSLPGTLAVPKLAWLPAAQSFVAIWIAEAKRDGVGTGIYGRVLGLAGTPEGSDFRISRSSAPGQDSPNLAAGNHGAVAVWMAEGRSTIYARRIVVQ